MKIALNDISKNYKDIEAVCGVTLELAEGEMFGLVGPNGAGKSTLLKMILGIVKPTGGGLRVDGKTLDEDGWKEFRRRIGYMPERVSFYDNLTGDETLNHFARIKGGNAARVIALMDKLLAGDMLSRRVSGYSKGMRQRLNLAQALLNDPDLLILDEPTSGLDPLGTKDFYDMLARVKGRKRLTVILSSHILAEIEDKVDRVGVLKNGRMKAVGTLEELYKGYELPLRLSISINARDIAMEELLRTEGAENVVYKDGCIVAAISASKKLNILSKVLERRNDFQDISIREPSLEEVFFGIH
jgi:Cu-processing system ATP-binding protein